MSLQIQITSRKWPSPLLHLLRYAVSAPSGRSAFSYLLSPNSLPLFLPQPSPLSILYAPPQALGDSIEAAFRYVFATLMTSPQGLVKTKFVGRYKSHGHAPDEEDVRDIVIELDHQFPDDISVFCVYQENVVKLQPGEVIFLGAGEPHAYVAGGEVYSVYHFFY